MQVRGFNGFSYADVAAELGVTTASLHYHFPGKAELGRGADRALRDALRRRARRHRRARSATRRAKLEAYAELYADVLRGQRMCLCGMLAAEYQTLPEPMRDAVHRASSTRTRPGSRACSQQGREAGTLAFAGEPREAAQQIVSALEGAMLVARPYGDVERFETAARRLLAGFAGAR